MPRKPPARTELDKLDRMLDEPEGKDKIFFTDIALAYADDMSAINKKFEAVRAKLVLILGRARIAAVKSSRDPEAYPNTNKP